MRGTIERARGWLRRYLPAELAAMLAVAGGAWAGQALTGNLATAALAGAWAENLAFYGTMFVRETRAAGRSHARWSVATRLFVEFGPAEALDSLLLRPGFLWAGLLLAPPAAPALGLVAGKVAADACFYAVAIAGYELHSRSPSS